MTRYIVAALAVAWLGLVTVAAFADPPPTTDADLLNALSQPAVVKAAVLPTEASTSDWTPIANQIFNALALALVAWVVKLISPAALKAGDWLGQRSAVEELLADNRMMETSEKLGRVGLDLALGRLGYTRADLKDIRIRNAAFNFAATFVHEQWPEVWKWVDKNQNGQIDWLESLVAKDLPPVDHTISAKAPAAA